ncbi:type II toxin-antitoxin system PemK/MazF family toxin [Companilactobacillus mishanensis]|uniref:Type II toxin-antitoxin system PemK/MazF family toxin n=1 Tax=Companilactobacillus mishanensis TaxID=2486008 RepID=A0ABW9P6M6_9LACO|nr:type II toxin-antitoxin system PemK/MazF family toxin [Companilactobacillus mishanensis]MQS44717.1 type II toxin-antitoxin system PemK/MazF family toxin [Companilactobacillus mishanensis]
MLGNNRTSPKQGDLIWINFEPHAGHEYGGHDPNSNNIRRPMLVMSSDIYNQLTGMIVGFPITSKIPNNYPTAIKISTNKISGYALTNSVLGYDFEARNGQVVDHVSNSVKVAGLDGIKDIFNIF